LKSLFNSNNQEEGKNFMRPPLWHPPIELSDPESLIIKRIKIAKLFTFLRLNRSLIFNNEFQEELATIFKDSTVGHSPVPPAQLALAIILQAYLGISDDEVIEEMMMDQRWQLVLDCLGSHKYVVIGDITRLYIHYIAILNDYTRYHALPGNAYPEALPP
jgi:hypothetical protein